MTSLLQRVSAIALLLAVALPAQAQQFDPTKPIRLIVGLAAGGGADVTARLVAQKMSESMKMTVLVENKAGGIFIPALREVANAAPDGHTLYFISTSSLITQPLHPDYPLDIMKLVPVTEVATGPLILAARNGLAVKTIKELIDLANSKPGTGKFGAGGGTGSSLYLATELLKARTGI